MGSNIDRRTWLKYTGASLLAASVPGRTEENAHSAPDATEEFPAIDPAKVNVDAAKLAKAVAFIELEVHAGSFPGAALVATRNGRKFLEHYCGSYLGFDGKNRRFGPLVSNPLFSFSKGITAIVAVMAHQEGLIDFDVPVSTYVPEFTGGGKEAITLRHLLTHSAGIPSVQGGAASTEAEWAAYLQKLCAASIEWPVGSKTAYHGLSGMFVVAEAVRRVSNGRPWNDICRERLFDPIGARSLSFGPYPAEFPRAVAKGYFTAEQNSMAGHPAGGCFGIVDDMLRVLNLIVQGGTWHRRTLLQPKALEDMLTVQYADEIAKAVAGGGSSPFEPWGLGWHLRGTAPVCAAGYWFGFGDSTSPTLFGHAGVDTVYGDGDPARDLAFVFITTRKARSADEATRIRREASNLLQDAVLTA